MSADEVDRATFDYLLQTDTPQLLDQVCRHLMQTKPKDPNQSIVSFLQAKKIARHGGVALLGHNITGGWLRLFDSAGQPRASLDRLNCRSDTNIQLLAVAPREPFLYVACISDSALADQGDAALPNEVRKFNFKGELQDIFAVGRSIACLATTTEKGHLWVIFEGGGGVVLQSNGSKIRDLSLPSAQGIIFLDHRLMWLLTSKSIELRDVESGQLETAVHLPDSMLKPTSFSCSRKHIWTAAANVDGSANFVGVFENTNGRAIPNFLPPQGSMIVADAHRGGTWHIARQSQNGLLTYTTEKAAKILSMELGASKKANIAVDNGSGLLWYFREGIGSGSGCRLGLYDPFSSMFVIDHEVPDLTTPSSQLLPL